MENTKKNNACSPERISFQKLNRLVGGAMGISPAGTPYIDIGGYRLNLKKSNVKIALS